jgi:hypothetical protein
MKARIKPAECRCAECQVFESLKNDPQLKAMRCLLRSTMATLTSEDKAEILHFIRQRKLEIIRGAA